MTVLLRIPALRAIPRLLFRPKPAAAAKPDGGETGPAAAKPGTFRIKKVLKTIIEGCLNCVIANRLTVVAVKSSS